MSLAEEVCKIIEETAGEPVHLESDLQAMGLDSLDLIHMLLSVENRYGVRIPDSDVLAIRQPADVVHFIERMKN